MVAREAEIADRLVPERCACRMTGISGSRHGEGVSLHDPSEPPLPVLAPSITPPAEDAVYANRRATTADMRESI
jgi:hypothetical protein